MNAQNLAAAIKLSVEAALSSKETSFAEVIDVLESLSDDISTLQLVVNRNNVPETWIKRCEHGSPIMILDGRNGAVCILDGKPPAVTTLVPQ